MSDLKEYRACIYTRLSRDDGDKAESDSIGNQRALIRDFLSGHPEIEAVSEQSDDGFTGVNFERPGFKRMMEEIRSGKVNCVVVKDDCVILELNAEYPRKCGFCGVSSVFLTQNRRLQGAHGRRKEGRKPNNQRFINS